MCMISPFFAILSLLRLEIFLFMLCETKSEPGARSKAGQASEEDRARPAGAPVQANCTCGARTRFPHWQRKLQCALWCAAPRTAVARPRSAHKNKLLPGQAATLLEPLAAQTLPGTSPAYHKTCELLGYSHTMKVDISRPQIDYFYNKLPGLYSLIWIYQEITMIFRRAA